MAPFQSKEAAAAAGRSRSPAKSEAARLNGARGGRKRKPLSEIPCTCGVKNPAGRHPTSCPLGRILWRRNRSLSR